MAGDDKKEERLDYGCEKFWDCEDYHYCKPYWEDGDHCKYYGGYCREYIECPMKKKYYKRYYGC